MICINLLMGSCVPSLLIIRMYFFCESLIINFTISGRDLVADSKFRLFRNFARKGWLASLLSPRENSVFVKC